jgi:hypothetical protein
MDQITSSLRSATWKSAPQYQAVSASIWFQRRPPESQFGSRVSASTAPVPPLSARAGGFNPNSVVANADESALDLHTV